MNKKERGKKIRQQILRDVKYHPTDITRHIATIFAITSQAVYRHIAQLVQDNYLTTQGKGKGKHYYLGDIRGNTQLFDLSANLEEDNIFRQYFAFIFEGLPSNIKEICEYGFTEMVNNAIDHSQGNRLFISTERESKSIYIYISDNGEGIFKRIKRLCGLNDERQAILELGKGKLTTDPENHTGEGIFFSARLFDYFVIESEDLKFSHSIYQKSDKLEELNTEKYSSGTKVFMWIKRDSKRGIKSIFDEFASADEYRFNKTVIPMRLVRFGNENLVSRSQAKRLLTRLENFANVVFDFTDINTIGQAFADEIFRVYQNKQPQIKFEYINASTDVKKMIKRALFVKN